MLIPRRDAAASKPGSAPPPGDPAPKIAADNAAWLAAFATHLAGRPVHTQAAYCRDVAVLAGLAGDIELTALAAPQLRRFVATLHGRGLSGRSLARMLSSWRAFYRYALERDARVNENPCVGLKPPRSPKRLPAAL